jgi:hypothetical protein
MSCPKIGLHLKRVKQEKKEISIISYLALKGQLISAQGKALGYKATSVNALKGQLNLHSYIVIQFLDKTL